MALPKATVQLQAPTQPLGTSFSQTAPVSSVDEDEETEGGGEGIANILSIIGFVAALVVLVFQFSAAGVWVNAPDNPNVGEGWMQLFN